MCTLGVTRKTETASHLSSSAESKDLKFRHPELKLQTILVHGMSGKTAVLSFSEFPYQIHLGITAGRRVS